MDSRELKGKVFRVITGARESNIDKNLTKDEVHKIYLKIIRRVHADLKELGFKKSGNVNLYRIENDIQQKLNFQKSAHGSTLTINTAIRPIFWHHPEDSYLLSCKRIGQFEAGFDKWYPISRDYLELAAYLSTLIKEKVIPHFERCNSPKKVVENAVVLENEEAYMYDDLILFCALRERNYELSSKYTTKELEKRLKYDESTRLITDETRFYSELLEQIKQKNFSEISKQLDSYKEQFLKQNEISPS